MVYLPQGFLWWQLSSIEFVGCGNRQGSNYHVQTAGDHSWDERGTNTDVWTNPKSTATR